MRSRVFATVAAAGVTLVPRLVRIKDRIDAYQDIAPRPGVSRNTVTVTAYACDDCGVKSTGSHHSSGTCDGLVLWVDDEWRCVGCGRPIDIAERCGECGSAVDVKRREVHLDLSPTHHPTVIEQAVHKATNVVRTKRECETLSFDYHLSAVAQRHSRDMAMRDYVSHESPDGTNPTDRYRIMGHDNRQSGENISLTYPGPNASSDSIAKEIVSGWMDSSGHRENILEDNWTEQGIGVYTARDGGVYTTQNFY